MPTQSRACPQLADSPWLGANGFFGDTFPIPAIWTVNSVYYTIFLDSGSFSAASWAANQLGFTSISPTLVTSATVNLRGVKTGGSATKLYLQAFAGQGVAGGGWGADVLGTSDSYSVSAFPQDISLTMTLNAFGQAYFNTWLATSNFLMGFGINSWDADDNFYIDSFDFAINYSSGISLQKKFLKSFSTLLPSS